jgi:hypothetical protein
MDNDDSSENMMMMMIKKVVVKTLTGKTLESPKSLFDDTSSLSSLMTWVRIFVVVVVVVFYILSFSIKLSQKCDNIHTVFSSVFVFLCKNDKLIANKQ